MEIYLCGKVDDRAFIVKNNELLLGEERHSLLLDLMELNGDVYFVGLSIDKEGIKIKYGINGFPDREITGNKMYIPIEIVGFKDEVPIVTYVAYENIETYRNVIKEIKKFGILINGNDNKLFF